MNADNCTWVNTFVLIFPILSYVITVTCAKITRSVAEAGIFRESQVITMDAYVMDVEVIYSHDIGHMGYTVPSLPRGTLEITCALSGCKIAENTNMFFMLPGIGRGLIDDTSLRQLIGS